MLITIYLELTSASTSSLMQLGDHCERKKRNRKKVNKIGEINNKNDLTAHS